MSKKQPPPREPVAPAKKQAIDAPRQSVFLVAPENLVLIGLDTKDGPEHPLYDETVHDAPDEELAESLGEFGQRQTLVIRKNGDALEVVSGRTRTKAARLWNTANPGNPLALACTFVRGKSNAELLELMVVENTHRKDKPPIVLAKQALRLKEEGRSYEQIAKVFRKTLQTIHTWLGNDGTGAAGIVDAAPELQSEMAAGNASVRDAQAVAELSHADQAAAVQIAKETGQSVATVAQTLAPSRRRGSSHEPSTKPGVQLMIAKIKDESIPDDLPWRQVLSWAAGVSAFPTSTPATEG